MTSGYWTLVGTSGFCCSGLVDNMCLPCLVSALLGDGDGGEGRPVGKADPGRDGVGDRRDGLAAGFEWQRVRALRDSRVAACASSAEGRIAHGPSGLMPRRTGVVDDFAMATFSYFGGRADDRAASLSSLWDGWTVCFTGTVLRAVLLGGFLGVFLTWLSASPFFGYRCAAIWLVGARVGLCVRRDCWGRVFPGDSVSTAP